MWAFSKTKPSVNASGVDMFRARYWHPIPPASDSESPVPAHYSPSPPKSLSSARVHISTSKGFWLSLYFGFNISLTLCNKTLLNDFPFPYTLTAIHSMFGVMGSTYLWHLGYFTIPKLSSSHKINILLFSLLYSLNIVISNASLSLVSIPFHQVVRSSAPIFTIVLSHILLGTRSSAKKIATLIPVVLGVTLATFGDYNYTYFGLLLTLLGTILAALKTVYTSILQSSLVSTQFSGLPAQYWFTPSSAPRVPLRLHPLALLSYLFPLAFSQCIFFAYITGELHLVRVFSSAQQWTSVIPLIGNGSIAFVLNVVSFNTTRQVGPIGMAVAGNIKQVLTILCAMPLFHLYISVLNGFGIFLALFGGMLFAWVEVSENKGFERMIRCKDDDELLNQVT